MTHPALLELGRILARTMVKEFLHEQKEVAHGSIEEEVSKQALSTTNKKAAPGIFARRPRAARKERDNGKYT